MSDVKQIYTIVNEAAKQAWGESALAVIDTASFISLGDKVLSSTTDTEVFLNSLVDRIGRTIFSMRKYSRNRNTMAREPFEYGCILRKITVEPPEAKENNSWEIGNDSYTPTYAPVIKSNVKQKLFNKVSTWEIDVTIPDYQLRTAFTSETDMAVLIDAIFTSMDNRMEQALESCGDLTRANFIARKINSAKPCSAINLLHNYNTLTNQTLTVDAALMDKEFLRYAIGQINLWIPRMAKISTLFNEEGFHRFTPDDRLVVNILNDFVEQVKTVLQSDTWHDELVKLPLYESVPYWQGTGTNYAFASTSAINVKIDDATTVEESGIIGVFYDYDAMGTSIVERRSSSERNNKDEYTDYYNKANMGYFNDMSENGIVFYMKEV